MKATTGSKSVYYTRGFELISRQEGSDVSFYLYDGGLSVRALTDESGSVTDTLVFDAFGNNAEKTGTTDNSYGFQGEEQDSTGLYYLRARYMDPATGTFTSMDTYGGSLSDPMSLHKYMFANANPVKYSDPSGHMSSLAEKVVVVGIMATLGAEMNGILYVFKLDDNHTHLTKDDFSSGLFDAMVAGVMSGIVTGLIAIVAIAILGTAIASIVLGGVGLVISVGEIIKGFSDYNNGSKKTGVTEIVFGIFGAILSGLNILSGIRSIIAKSNVGLKPNESPSTYAKGQQGTGSYPGVDEYTDSIWPKGKELIRGEPNGTDFFTTNKGLESSGGRASDLFQGLQVRKHPIYGYKTEVGVYVSDVDLACAKGFANANPKLGSGGYPQVVVPNANNLITDGKLRLVRTVTLS